MPRSALVSCASPEHYLPAKYAAAARHVLGWIGTDPATSEIANRTIGAERIFTVDNPGNVLSAVWHGPTICNPPGSRDGALLVDFWRLCCAHARRWPVLWVGYSLEQLRRLGQLAEEGLPAPSRLPMVIVSERIKWETPAAVITVSGVAQARGLLALEIGGLVVELRVRRGQHGLALARRIARALRTSDEFCVDVEIDPEDDHRALVHVVSRERVDYTAGVSKRPKGIRASVRRNEQPTHGNYFLLLGGGREQRTRFAEAFGAFGDYFPPRGRPPGTRDLAAEILRAIDAGPGPISSDEIQARVRARRASVFAYLGQLHQDGLVAPWAGKWSRTRKSEEGSSLGSGTQL